MAEPDALLTEIEMGGVPRLQTALVRRLARPALRSGGRRRARAGRRSPRPRRARSAGAPASRHQGGQGQSDVDEVEKGGGGEGALEGGGHSVPVRSSSSKQELA